MIVSYCVSSDMSFDSNGFYSGYSQDIRYNGFTNDVQYQQSPPIPQFYSYDDAIAHQILMNQQQYSNYMYCNDWTFPQPNINQFHVHSHHIDGILPPIPSTSNQSETMTRCKVNKKNRNKNMKSRINQNQSEIFVTISNITPSNHFPSLHHFNEPQDSGYRDLSSNPPPPSKKVKENNQNTVSPHNGFKLLQKLGYSGTGGLGKYENGAEESIAHTIRTQKDKKGLGVIKQQLISKVDETTPITTHEMTPITHEMTPITTHEMKSSDNPKTILGNYASKHHYPLPKYETLHIRNEGSSQVFQVLCEFYVSSDQLDNITAQGNAM